MIFPRSGKNGLIFAQASPFRTPASRITFDQIQLALLHFAADTVANLPGRPPPPSASFRLRRISLAFRAASRASAWPACLCGRSILATFGFSSRYLPRQLTHHGVDDPLDFTVTELGFCLAFKLRMRNARGQDHRQSFTEIIAAGDQIFILEDVLLCDRSCSACASAHCETPKRAYPLQSYECCSRRSARSRCTHLNTAGRSRTPRHRLRH